MGKPFMDLQVDDPSLQPDHGRLGSVVSAQLGQDVLDSPFDSFFSDRQLICNLLIGVSGGDQPKHADFGRRQRIIRRMLGDLIRRFRGKRLFPGVNRSNGFREFLVNRVFQQIALRSRFESVENLYIALVGRQHNDFRIGCISS